MIFIFIFLRIYQLMHLYLEITNYMETLYDTVHRISLLLRFLSETKTVIFSSIPLFYGMSIYFFHFNLTKKRKSLRLKRIDLLILSGRLLHPPVFHARKKMNVKFTDPKVDRCARSSCFFFLFFFVLM